MTAVDTLVWSLRYRAIATGAFLLGLVVFVLGLAAGFSGAIGTFVADPLDPGAALSEVNLAVVGVLALVGLVIWQLGKAFALFVTLPRATGRRAAKSMDTKKLRSEVLEALDGRLADMEAEIEETRRSVQELKRDEHAASFDEATDVESVEAAVSSSTSAAGDRQSGAAGSARERTGTVTDHRTDEGSGSQQRGNDSAGSR